MRRREFLKGTAAGVVAGATGGTVLGSLVFPKTITKPGPQPWLPTRWDQTADIVVVGYGGAGAVTAITAHDAGASVLILEKTPSLASLAVPGASISGGGGNTHINGGRIIVPSDSSEGAKHAYYLCWGTTPMPVCQAWANLAVQINAYLDNLGVRYTTAKNTSEMSNFPGASSITTSIVNGGGATLFQALDQAVQSRKINTLFGTTAIDLIQDPSTKEIVGVKAISNPPPSGTTTAVWKPPASGGIVINIKANRGVVLCTGGFEYDDDMKANYLKMYPVHFTGWIYNTGDGLRMASKAGAGFWHMNMFTGGGVPWFPDNDMAYSYFINTIYPMIITDKYGRRYADESSPVTEHNWWVLLDEFDIKVPEYTRIPSFLIFDETFRTKNSPIGGVQLPTQLGGLKWSQDNSAEITKGYIQKGNTPADLAAAINQTKYEGWNSNDSVTVPSGINVNIDPNVLTDTITKYNSYCAVKKDPDFGRNPNSLNPLATPPFYALPLWPGGSHSQGGPVRNEKAQVLNTAGNPIPRLYSAGELGSMWGLNPTGGGNNSELIVFGQIAGKNVAAETTRT